MAGQATVYYVTYVDPASGGGGNPSAGGAPPPPPPFAGQGLQQGPPSSPPYPGPRAPQDQGRPPAAPAYDAVVPKVHQFHRPGPSPLPPRVPNGQQQQQQQQGQRQQQQWQQQQPPQQQQQWQQLQQQQWQRRGYAPPAFPVVNGNDDAAGGRKAANKAGDNVAAVEKENRQKKWALFVIGNVISVAVVVFETSELDVCFEENVSFANVCMTFTVTLGLLANVFSAVALFLFYGSPLDIKSVHKIPAGDMRHCGGTIMVNFLALFSWSLIYLFGGLASYSYGQNAPCGGGYGGEALESYLVISAAIMLLFSFGMLFLSGVMLLLACVSCPQRRAAQNAGAPGTSPTRPAGCCTRILEKLYTKVLSKSPIYDLGWQLQGVILSYRAGAFSLATAVLVGSAGVFGEVLAAFGSLAPVAVEELLGPVMV